MKKLQNTLYILTPGSALSLCNEAVVVAVGGEEKLRVPAHGIERILCFGNTTVTTPLIQFCGEKGIALSWFSEYGRFSGAQWDRCMGTSSSAASSSKLWKMANGGAPSCAAYWWASWSTAGRPCSAAPAKPPAPKPGKG